MSYGIGMVLLLNDRVATVKALDLMLRTGIWDL